MLIMRLIEKVSHDYFCYNQIFREYNDLGKYKKFDINAVRKRYFTRKFRKFDVLVYSYNIVHNYYVPNMQRNSTEEVAVCRKKQF